MSSPPTLDTQQDIARFVRDIKGAAASILWILLLSGNSLTKEQLENATGYSDKPIAKGLQRLTEYGLVQDNGRYHGWSITSTKQLPLPLQALWQGHDGVLLDGTESAQTGRPQEVACSTAGSQAPLLADVGSQDTPPSESEAVDNSVDNSDLPQLPLLSSTRPQPPNSEKFRPQPSELGKIPSSPPPTRKNSEFASRDLDCLIDQSLKDQERSINQSDQESARKNSELRQLMAYLGIHGRAFIQFEQQAIDPDHLLAWHWWSLCQLWLTNRPGYIVTLLHDGKLPEGAWLAAVQWWQGLEWVERGDVLGHITGFEGGRVNGMALHPPAQSVADLLTYLRLYDEPQPDSEDVLKVLMLLAKQAIEELRRFACEHGE